MTGETETVERVGWSLFCGQGSAVRAAHLDPTNPAFWLSKTSLFRCQRCAFPVVGAPPRGTPLHSTPRHSPAPPEGRTFFGETDPKPRLGHV